MEIYVQKYPAENLIVLMARAESKDGRTVGDMVQEVRPGETTLGRTYEEWLASESTVILTG
jgi:hypothetical protein